MAVTENHPGVVANLLGDGLWLVNPTKALSPSHPELHIATLRKNSRGRADLSRRLSWASAVIAMAGGIAWAVVPAVRDLTGPWVFVGAFAALVLVSVVIVRVGGSGDQAMLMQSSDDLQRLDYLETNAVNADDNTDWQLLWDLCQALDELWWADESLEWQRTGLGFDAGAQATMSQNDPEYPPRTLANTELAKERYTRVVDEVHRIAGSGGLSTSVQPAHLRLAQFERQAAAGD